MKIILQAIKALFRKVENAIKDNVSAISKLSSKIASVEKSLNAKVKKVQSTANSAVELANTAQLKADSIIIPIVTNSVETKNSKYYFSAQSPHVTTATKFTKDMLGMIFLVDFHATVDKPAYLKINNLPSSPIGCMVTNGMGYVDYENFRVRILNGKLQTDVKASVLVRLTYWYSDYVFEVIGDYSATSSKVYCGDCVNASTQVDKKVVELENFTSVSVAYVIFSSANTAENPTLNVDGTKYPICDKQGNPISPDAIKANTMYHFVKNQDFSNKTKWFMME